jgi:hypothetical protein
MDMTELETLRRDFADTRSMMISFNEWTPAQAAEVGAGIADVVKSNDAGELRVWCAWFALRGEAARSLATVGSLVLNGLRRAA